MLRMRGRLPGCLSHESRRYGYLLENSNTPPSLVGQKSWVRCWVDLLWLAFDPKGLNGMTMRLRPIALLASLTLFAAAALSPPLAAAELSIPPIQYHQRTLGDDLRHRPDGHFAHD